MSKKIDLSGKRFGRLFVHKWVSNNYSGNSMWQCECECGTLRIVRGAALINGHTKSCGCLREEKRFKHGMTIGGKQPSLYSIWRHLRNRCSNKKADGYKYYGGRGITVCSEWETNFQPFCDWAMTNGYKKGLTIDRIDTNGNYEPSNCRWATMATQSRNKRNNVYIEYNNEKRVLKDWSNLLSIPWTTLRWRLKNGWSVEKTFNYQGGGNHG